MSDAKGSPNAAGVNEFLWRFMPRRASKGLMLRLSPGAKPEAAKSDQFAPTKLVLGVSPGFGAAVGAADKFEAPEEIPKLIPV
jgi:hypothetical protein